MKIITPKTLNWIETVADVLEQGGIVIHPTDTAYGIAVDATNPRAIDKVYRLKKRDGKPLITVVKNIDHAQDFVHVTPKAKKIAEHFFPGPLTIVLQSKGILPTNLTAGNPKIGIRQPNSDITQAISNKFDKPYTSTSANLSGGPTSYSVPQVLNQLEPEIIDLVIDLGELPVRPTSTVVDLSSDEIEVHREGPITFKEIASLLAN